ncbi:hypothetical protein M885DRAFT_531693 [Pelagophyceae sp. CCMP2097]|nr:hypothetical protein M885DRAFT_531693 [Pelagophyceae sp. CCMP2097]
MDDVEDPLLNPLLLHAGLDGDAEGLSSAEAAARLVAYGRNEVPIEEVPLWRIFARQFMGTMPVMLMLSCLLAAAVEDWQDLGIITVMLILNGVVAFCEETKAAASLDALRGKLKQEVSVRRDGAALAVDVTDLVPGDVVALRGGQAVPADALWLSGDVIKLDTAALTGEPVPWSVPRALAGDAVRASSGDSPEMTLGARCSKFSEKGRRMLSGCTVLQGECECLIVATGARTEVGRAVELVAEAQSGPRPVGLFESKIVEIVRFVIVATLLTTVVVFCVQLFVRREPLPRVLLVALSLIIGAVPIALPLVLQVTMALGARAMADHGAIITHVSALQEIASMTFLNSDKTGTLTTAKMSVLPQMVWVDAGFNSDEVLTHAALASNASNLEDPIDVAVLAAFHAHFSNDGTSTRGASAVGAARLAAYGRREAFSGFNPDVKRAVAVYRHEDGTAFRVAKGLLDKILDTGGDGGADQWQCDGGAHTRAKAADEELSAAGYKTIAVSVQALNTDGSAQPMLLAGLVPMLDPPREDTAATISALRAAGVEVKMITGDHLNIARETARLVGLGGDIRPNTALWPASATRDVGIFESDGFAQVMPADKREVVLVLQNRLDARSGARTVVGMTGDGVNDAAALAQAQVGIAVQGATDAAKDAADIVLTFPGLSAIYAAVYESRMIFRRVRAYVLYRVAATVQIVLVLCVLTLAFNDEIKPLYVVVLALVNDATMTPIAHDNARPSPKPEIPTVAALLAGAVALGAAQAFASVLFFVHGPRITGLGSEWHEEPLGRQASMFLQICVAVELLIFACREADKPLWLASMPSRSLVASVFAGNTLVTLMCRYKVLVKLGLGWRAIAGIWLYDVAALLLIDAFKAVVLYALSTDAGASAPLAHPDTIAVAAKRAPARLSTTSLRSTIAGRLSEQHSRTGSLYRAPSSLHHAPGGRASLFESPSRRHSLLGASLRPNTPHNLVGKLGGLRHSTG